MSDLLCRIHLWGIIIWWPWDIISACHNWKKKEFVSLHRWFQSPTNKANGISACTVHFKQDKRIYKRFLVSISNIWISFSKQSFKKSTFKPVQNAFIASSQQVDNSVNIISPFVTVLVTVTSCYCRLLQLSWENFDFSPAQSLCFLKQSNKASGRKEQRQWDQKHSERYLLSLDMGRFEPRLEDSGFSSLTSVLLTWLPRQTKANHEHYELLNEHPWAL